MFETRSHVWRDAGLIGELSPQVARRARIEGLALLAAFVGVVVVYNNRQDLLGIDTAHSRHAHPEVDSLVHVVVVLTLLILGWAVARDAGRALRPLFFSRMEPATAGTAGFLIRLTTVVVTLFIALQVAGVQARTLAVGGAVTAVIVGLAAQQTLGNLIAGLVLLSARPFRVGEQVRLLSGPLGGQIEGVVSSLGLLYTTLATGGESESVQVPNSAVLAAAVSVQRSRAHQGGVPHVAPDPQRDPADSERQDQGRASESSSRRR